MSLPSPALFLPDNSVGQLVSARKLRHSQLMRGRDQERTLDLSRLLRRVLCAESA